MRENRDFVVPVNILTTFARAPFSWAARHTTVCLDAIHYIQIDEPVRKLTDCEETDYCKHLISHD